jgi:hypothetical protein
MKAVLDALATERGDYLTSIVELVRRKDREINECRERLGIEWRERPPMGRPKTTAE